MWMGVFRGFAGLKFSGSPILLGYKSTMEIRIIKNKDDPKESLILKKGWKGILSMFGFIPVGEFDPVICKDIKWIIISALKMNGSKKWIIKNRFNVAPPTENPPHSHSTIVFPM